MSVWTITYDSGSGPVEQSAAAWGLNANPIIRTRDRSETVFSFLMAGAAPESSIPFPFQAKVIIKQNRTYAAGSWSGSGLVFTGYQTTQKGRVNGSRQGVMLDFADAIWLLKNTTFMQLWTQNADDGMGGVVTTSVPESRCILFMDIATYNATPWSLKSVQWQVNEIINYAASCGIEIAAGTIDYSSWEINYHHVSAISCWDALLKCLEPVADAKVWVDGSTSTPTLHVRTRAALAALAPPTTTAPGPVTLPYKGVDAAGRRHISTDLNPRYDLIPTQVVLQYQTNDTVNGQSAPYWTSDVYPPASTGQAPFAMVVPIDLSGAAYSVSSGRLDAETLACVGGSQASKRAWWASKRGGEQAKLADFRIRFQDVKVKKTYDDASNAWLAAHAGDYSGANTAGIAAVTAAIAISQSAYNSFIGAHPGDYDGADAAARAASGGVWYVTIPDATVTDDSGAAINLSNFPRRLIGGTYHPWMDNGGTPINCVRAHIRVKIQTVEYDEIASTPAETDGNGNIVRITPSHELHCHVTLTNSPNGIKDYVDVGIASTAEIPAVNLAQNIYESRSALDYDGTHEIVDPGIPSGPSARMPLAQIIGHWNVLNLVGGATEWETANMTIAGSTIDLMTNHQTIDIGPARHLSPQDWNQMLQFFRNRRTFFFAGARASGYGGGTSRVDMARNTPDGNTVAGLKVDSMHALIGVDTVDPTRTNVFKQDATTGQLQIVQQPTAGGAAYTTGLLAAEYSGAGAPSASTLATSACYRVGDKYFDTAATSIYRCTTAGSKSTSVWAAVSSAAGSSIQFFKIIKDIGDAFLAKPWDGTTLGDVAQPIIKPWKMFAGTNKLASQVVLGVTYTYTYTAVTVSGVTAFYTRAVSGSDGSSATDYPIPLPVANDIIQAEPGPAIFSGIPSTILSAVLVNSGTGGTYAVNDTLTVAGGTGTAATIKVLTVSAGKIVTFRMLTEGLYTALPSMSANAVTGGGGSGATFNLTAAPVLYDRNVEGRAWSK